MDYPSHKPKKSTSPSASVYSNSGSSSTYSTDSPNLDFYSKLSLKEKEYVSPYSESESSTAAHKHRKSSKPAPSPLANTTYSSSSSSSNASPKSGQSKMSSSKKMSSVSNPFLSVWSLYVINKLLSHFIFVKKKEEESKSGLTLEISIYGIIPARYAKSCSIPILR